MDSQEAPAHDCWRRERVVARVETPDIRDDDHGGLMFGGGFKYDLSGQGWGYRIDIEFVQKIMAVFGYPTCLRDLEGKACWVTHCNSAIHLVEPLLPNEGKAFDVDAWSEEAHARAEVLRATGTDQWSLDEAARKAKAK